MRGFSLNPGEEVVRVFRQSKWMLFKPLALSMVGIAAPWWYILRLGFTDIQTAVTVWTVLVTLYALREYKLWSVQKYFITNRRLIKVHHEALFKKVVVETPLERILNVSFKTTGLFSVLGRFGDVEVQVVGLMEPIILKNITHPASIKEYLWQAHGRVATDFNALEFQKRTGYTKPNQRII